MKNSNKEAEYLQQLTLKRIKDTIGNFIDKKGISIKITPSNDMKSVVVDFLKTSQISVAHMEFTSNSISKEDPKMYEEFLLLEKDYGNLNPVIEIDESGIVNACKCIIEVNGSRYLGIVAKGSVLSKQFLSGKPVLGTIIIHKYDGNNAKINAIRKEVTV